MITFKSLALSAALIFTLSASVLASDSPLEPAENDLQEFIQEKLPDFRIVKSMERFPERFNASIKLNIVTTRVEDGRPMTSLVTLYEGTTGEPLESCHTPCVLHKEPGRMVHIFPHRHGHLPLLHTIDIDPSEMAREEENWDGIYGISLGPDYRKAQFQKRTCERTFAAQPKTDRDAKPCYRTPPFTPQIDFSGYCKMEFDISRQGNTQNINVKECTDPIFEVPSRIAISMWKYHPKVERGVAVSRPDVVAKVRFDITDYDGHLLDHDGERVPN
jgi:hypothetical protein